MIKADKQIILDILGIKEEALKKVIKSKQLEQRLKNKGYTLHDKIKEGRKVYYLIELISNDKENYSNLCKYYYNTNKEYAFGRYFTVRTIAEHAHSKKDLAELSEVTTKTITKWDNTLIDNDIITKDGFYYFSIDKADFTVTQCTETEYKNFWKNKKYLDAFYSLQQKYIRGELTLTELQLASAEIGSITTLLEGKYYYRVKKYKTNTKNEILIETLQLIKNLYGYNIDIPALIGNKEENKENN